MSSLPSSSEAFVCTGWYNLRFLHPFTEAAPLLASLDSLGKEGEALCMLETICSSLEPLSALPAEEVDMPASEDGDLGEVWL